MKPCKSCPKPAHPCYGDQCEDCFINGSPSTSRASKPRRIDVPVSPIQPEGEIRPSAPKITTFSDVEYHE